MKVKPVDPNAIIRDPHTKRPLPVEGDTVPDSNFWVRRRLDKEVEDVVDEPSVPTGNEPIQPLNTRGK
jgi:hypothetical protein